MPTFTRSSTTNADGNTTQQSDSVSGEESQKVQLALTAPLSGTLTTRTDDDTGVITLASGHGLTTSDFVSVFGTDASGNEIFRANMDITAQDATTITVNAGQGDNLPLVNATVVVGKVSSRVVSWDGTAAGLKGFTANCGSRRGSITAQEVGTLIGLAGTDLIKHLKSTSPGYTWLNTDGSFAFTAAILFLTGALGDNVGVAGTATFVGLDA